MAATKHSKAYPALLLGLYRPIYEEFIKTVADELKIDYDLTFIKKTRISKVGPPYMLVRHATTFALFNEFNFIPFYIGKLLGQHHSTTLHSLALVRDLWVTSSHYRAVRVPIRAIANRMLASPGTMAHMEEIKLFRVNHKLTIGGMDYGKDLEGNSRKLSALDRLAPSPVCE